MRIGDRLAGRPVFVTGADGFIGSHLVEYLLEPDADVQTMIRATSSAELKNIRHVGDRITVHRGDLRDLHSTREALSDLGDRSDILEPISRHTNTSPWRHRRSPCSNLGSV